MSNRISSSTRPDDRAFDLLKAVADHADAHGLKRTSALAEAAMDAWLLETRAVGPKVPETRTKPRFRRGAIRWPADGAR